MKFPNGANCKAILDGSLYLWRRDPESNRAERICNHVRNSMRTMRYLGNGLRTGRAEGMERIKLGDKFPNALARKL